MKNLYILLNDSSPAGRSSLLSLARKIRLRDQNSRIVYIARNLDSFECDYFLRLLNFKGSIRYLAILINRIIILLYLLGIKCSSKYNKTNLIVLTDRSINTEPFAIYISKKLGFQNSVIPFAMTSKYVRLFRRLNCKYLRTPNSLRCYIYRFFEVVPLKDDNGNEYDFYTLPQWLFGGMLLLPKYPWSIGGNKNIDHSFHQSYYEIMEEAHSQQCIPSRHWSGTPSHDEQKNNSDKQLAKILTIALPQLFKNGITDEENCYQIWEKIITCICKEFPKSNIRISLHPKDKNDRNLKFLSKLGFENSDLQGAIECSSAGIAFFIGTAISMYANKISVIAVDDYDPHFKIINNEENIKLLSLNELLSLDVGKLIDDINHDSIESSVRSSKIGRFDFKCSDRIIDVIK